MQPAEIARAKDAATAVASAQGLAVEDATSLWNSNKLALRLLPADVFARVAHAGEAVARFEVELAQRLADLGAPIALLEPRVPARVYERDGFAITLWTYYEAAPTEITPAEYADALQRLHAAMRKVDMPSPHFMDRVDEAQAVLGNPALSPALATGDREFLEDTLRRVRRTIETRGYAEQLLHGEPHPGNLLGTNRGPRFIDLETCCRGPIEFDVAHVTEAARRSYPHADEQLVGDCRRLVLAMVAAWRVEPNDQLPNGPRALQLLLDALRAGPPWPALDAVMR